MIADKFLKFCIGLAIAAGLFLFVMYGVVAYGDGQHAANKFDPLAAVVKLGNDKSHCSGAHVGNGYVLTAAHCAELPVLSARGDVLATEVAFKDAAHDVAVLLADALAGAPRASLSCKRPQVGDEVIAAGHPGPFNFAVFYGRVAHRPITLPLADGEQITNVIGIDVTGMGGMSGGPVFAGSRIAAVFVAGPQYRVPTRALFFATPLSAVCDKLPVPLT